MGLIFWCSVLSVVLAYFSFPYIDNLFNVDKRGSPRLPRKKIMLGKGSSPDRDEITEARILLLRGRWRVEEESKEWVGVANGKPQST